jgi:hypothetical protein
VLPLDGVGTAKLITGATWINKLENLCPLINWTGLYGPRGDLVQRLLSVGSKGKVDERNQHTLIHNERHLDWIVCLTNVELV